MTPCDELSRYLMGAIVVLAAVIIAQAVHAIVKDKSVITSSPFQLDDSDDDGDDSNETEA